MRFILFTVFLFQSVSGISQRDSLFFTNSSTVDEDRYPNVQSTPYFFEEFMMGDITRRDGFVFQDVKVNFNAFTNEFEIREDDKFIVLDVLWYLEISVSADKNPGLERDVVFRPDVHPSYKAKFVEVIYQGENVTLINDFKIDKTEKTIQNVGKAVTFERFVPVNSYKIIQGTNINLLRPKKEVVAKMLGHEKEFFKFLKANKIKKLNEKENLFKTAEWYDRQLGS